MPQICEFAVAESHVSSDTLSRSVTDKLFQTAGPLYAKLRCATDVCTLGN